MAALVVMELSRTRERRFTFVKGEPKTGLTQLLIMAWLSQVSLGPTFLLGDGHEGQLLTQVQFFDTNGRRFTIQEKQLGSHKGGI
jgi:hypothetical protein